MATRLRKMLLRKQQPPWGAKWLSWMWSSANFFRSLTCHFLNDHWWISIDVPAKWATWPQFIRVTWQSNFHYTISITCESCLSIFMMPSLFVELFVILMPVILWAIWSWKVFGHYVLPKFCSITLFVNNKEELCYVISRNWQKKNSFQNSKFKSQDLNLQFKIRNSKLKIQKF